jgi:hypothetical protein
MSLEYKVESRKLEQRDSAVIRFQLFAFCFQLQPEIA